MACKVQTEKRGSSDSINLALNLEWIQSVGPENYRTFFNVSVKSTLAASPQSVSSA